MFLLHADEATPYVQAFGSLADKPRRLSLEIQLELHQRLGLHQHLLLFTLGVGGGDGQVDAGGTGVRVQGTDFTGNRDDVAAAGG